MSAPVYLTKEGLNKLEDELRHLKTKGRAEIAEKIAYARSHGDLSENADYDAAKHEQELLEMRISKIESTLNRTQVIDPKEFPEGKVYILSNVKLRNKKNNSEITYTLVSEEEADFMSAKLAVNSPLGKALLGKATGETVSAKVPAGIIEYEILDIWK
ncbi:transcription elongation factor GreA [Ignavibacteria bacterium]|nr:transcription elongation factor GreA [Bacteroidota bacterium]MCZ2132802.1 transcription elongation factor GreA [Bacteroidota bacterium]